MSASPTDPVNDWVTRAADDAIRHAGEDKQVTVSSGVSPSGRVHLGNMREFLTVHFVADELRRNPDVQEFYLGLSDSGERRSYRDVKHYKRRKRWL